MFDLCVKCWFVPKYVQRFFDFKSKPRGCLIDDGKISREHAERNADELSRCLKMCEALSVFKCSLTRVLKCRVVSPTKQAAQPAHENL